MPFALAIVGIVLIIAGVRDKISDLGTLVKGDFSGDGNFLNWVAAIGIVGGVGYIPALRGVSRAFLGLILVVMLLSDRGFMAQLAAAIDTAAPSPASGQTAPQVPLAASGGVPKTPQGGGGGGGGGAPMAPGSGSITGAIPGALAGLGSTLGNVLTGNVGGIAGAIVKASPIGGIQDKIKTVKDILK